MLIPPQVRHLLVSLARQRWRRLLILFLFCTVQTVVATAGDPLVLKWLVDSLAARDLKLFLIIGVSAVVFYTGTRVLDYAYSILKAKVRLAIMADYSERYAELYYQQPFSDIRGHDNGYYTGRIFDESKELAGTLDTAIDIYRSVIGFFSAVAVCLWLSWQLALVVTVVVPLLLYIAQRFTKKITSSSSEVQETEAYVRDTLGRVVSSYRLYFNVVEAKLPFTMLRASIGKNVDARLDLNKHSALFRMASGISLSYAEMAVMLGAGFTVIAGKISVGGLFSFMSAYWKSVNAAQRLIDLAPQMGRLEGVAMRLRDFEQSASTEIGASLRTEHDRISFDDVRISLGADRVSNALSFTWRLGDRVLIVGANGSGKSTLIDAICGLRHPAGGSLRTLSKGLVSCQFTEATFFPGTVRQNLEEVAGNDADVCMKRLGLLDRGDLQPYLLSAGEQRKLQIAMVLARESSCYVFDEPLSNLDVESKEQVMKLILERAQGKLLIVVMHGDVEWHSNFNLRFDLSSPEESARRRRASLAAVE
ncbi:MAG: ATP-binding cassette domain-containing protein [Lysobacter sp.]